MQDNIPDMQRIVWLSDLAREDHVSDRPEMTSIHLRLTQVVPRVWLEHTEIGYEGKGYGQFAVYSGLDPSDVAWTLFALGEEANVVASGTHLHLREMEVRGVFQLLRNQAADTVKAEPRRMLGLVRAKPIRLVSEAR